MAFTINSVPFTVKTGVDLTTTQRAKFASDFELIQVDGNIADGNLVVGSGGKLTDGGAIPSTANLVAKKPSATENNFASFAADGDLQDSGKSESDFLQSADLTGFTKVYTTLGDLDITTMDSSNWVANAEAIITALKNKGGGVLEITKLSGSTALSNLAASIASTGSQGGKLSFSPSGGRFVARYASNTTDESTFQVFANNNVGVCSAAYGSIGVWRKLITDAVTTFEPDSSKISPRSGMGTSLLVVNDAIFEAKEGWLKFNISITASMNIGAGVSDLWFEVTSFPFTLRYSGEQAVSCFAGETSTTGTAKAQQTASDKLKLLVLIPGLTINDSSRVLSFSGVLKLAD